MCEYGLSKIPNTRSADWQPHAHPNGLSLEWEMGSIILVITQCIIGFFFTMYSIICVFILIFHYHITPLSLHPVSPTPPPTAEATPRTVRTLTERPCVSLCLSVCLIRPCLCRSACPLLYRTPSFVYIYFQQRRKQRTDTTLLYCKQPTTTPSPSFLPLPSSPPRRRRSRSAHPAPARRFTRSHLDGPGCRLGM